MNTVNLNGCVVIIIIVNSIVVAVYYYLIFLIIYTPPYSLFGVIRNPFLFSLPFSVVVSSFLTLLKIDLYIDYICIIIIIIHLIAY
mgnify:CR=1 FL=1